MHEDRIRAQLALVEEHVRRENAHDLPGIMATLVTMRGMTMSHGVSITRGLRRSQRIIRTF